VKGGDATGGTRRASRGMRMPRTLLWPARRSRRGTSCAARSTFRLRLCFSSGSGNVSVSRSQCFRPFWNAHAQRTLFPQGVGPQTDLAVRVFGLRQTYLCWAFSVTARDVLIGMTAGNARTCQQKPTERSGWNSTEWYPPSSSSFPPAPNVLGLFLVSVAPPLPPPPPISPCPYTHAVFFIVLFILKAWRLGSPAHFERSSRRAWPRACPWWVAGGVNYSV
jgi:hypothetical protein